MTTQEFNYGLISLEDNLEKFALSLTSNKEDANDLTQETYLKALNNRDKFKDYVNFKAWVFTIMKNIFINDYRRSRIKQKYNDASRADFIFNEKVYQLAPDAVLNMKEMNKKIERLDEHFKTPFRLFLAGYKYKEIAKNLGLNIGTVKSRIFLTRKKLSNELAS
jgi:RNA polymerase sigma factor (sigma-70 family)